jgi:hypothetical protein
MRKLRAAAADMHHNPEIGDRFSTRVPRKPLQEFRFDHYFLVVIIKNQTVCPFHSDLSIWWLLGDRKTVMKQRAI